MKKIVCFMVAAFCISATSFAQTESKKEKEEEDIIIKRSGKNKEKITVVVDGDNITVNGKPLAQFKDGDIEIIRGKGGFRLIAPTPPSAPKIARGYAMNTKRAFLGVVTEQSDNGAKITEVSAESAAAKAGLKKDDIIIKINDFKISNSEDLYQAIGKFKPNDKITVTYLRNGKENKVTATLGSNNTPSIVSTWERDFDFDFPELRGMNVFAFGRPKLGVEVQDTEDNAGVTVLDVDENTPAAKGGLQKDDLITAVNGKKITAVSDMREVLSQTKEGDVLKIEFKRNGTSQQTEIKFPKKLRKADL